MAMVNCLNKMSWKLVQNWLTISKIHSPWLTHVIMRITTVACYVIQQNNCVCANQSGICTCTHKIIYHRVFRALLLHIILSTVCSTHVKKLGFYCNTIFALFYCMEYHLTVSRNKRNDILFIGQLSAANNLYNVWDYRRHFVCNIF